MYKNVLCAFDGTEGAKAALKRSVILANVYGATVTVVWVRAPIPHHILFLDQDTNEDDAAEAYFEELKQQAREIAQAEGASIECVSLYGDAAREIVHYADKKNMELIVVGQTGHSDFISRMLGQTADRISETALCDVLIVRYPHDT